MYNLLGQKLATLVSEKMAPGSYSTTWNAADSRSTAFGTGLYFIRMTAHPDGRNASFTSVRKLLLLK